MILLDIIRKKTSLWDAILVFKPSTFDDIWSGKKLSLEQKILLEKAKILLNEISETGWKLKLKEQFRYGEWEIVENLPQRLSEMADQLNANTPMR